MFTSIQDNEIRLLKNGTIAGNNKATNTNWTGTDTYYTYGGTTDKWGDTWTLANITSGNFGVLISSQILGIVGVLPSARIDNVQVTVYYNLILPIPITSFSATAIKNAVALKWQTPHPANDETFVVQRSADGTDWEALSGSIRHDQWLKQFEFIDNKPLAVSYYRIKTETKGGVTQYTDIRKHETSSFRKIIVYPNPAHNTINIQNAGASEIKLYNIAGQLVVKSQLLPAVNTIDITKLKPGIYFIVTGYNSQQILIQKDRM